MLTLDEAIKHCEEATEKNEIRASWFRDKEGYENCIECANEHRQLAEWLRDYKKLLEQQLRWIPVKERLPKENGNYLVTKEVYFTPDHVDDINHYRTVSVNYYDTKYSWLGDEVYAWMPLPELYKAESEE